MDFKLHLRKCLTGHYGYESAHQIHHTKLLPHPNKYAQKPPSKISRYYFCLKEDDVMTRINL